MGLPPPLLSLICSLSVATFCTQGARLCFGVGGQKRGLTRHSAQGRILEVPTFTEDL